MANLFISSDVFISIKASLENDKIQRESIKRLGPVPTLYDDNHSFVSPVNLWFIHLISVRKLTNLSSYSRALLRYWRFLEREQLSWNKFAPIKSLKPTYRFRNEDLLASTKVGNLAYSTANLYISHVVQFYIWAIQENLVKVTEINKPFDIEFVTLTSPNPISHMLPKFSVQTSDLRIRVPKDACSGKKRPLSPLTEADLSALARELARSSIELRLIVLISVQCGLRQAEATAFTVEAMDECYLKSKDSTYYEVMIGPNNGIPTKNGKRRVIQIPIELMLMLRNYLTSNRRAERARKSLSNNVSTLSDSNPHRQKEFNRKSDPTLRFESLFLTQQGLSYKTSSVSARFSEIRKNIRNNGDRFEHKFHDLRASYATYRLKSLLDAGVSTVDSLSLIMQWMGHSKESTTWKYLKYLSHRSLLEDKMSLLDTILHQALEEQEGVS